MSKFVQGRVIQPQTSLTREQKEAVGLLSIGTFLEYFDLMLYVHLAVLLNELFFPKYEDMADAFLSAFAFCSTFIFRPIGALIFGKIGDTWGRKSTVIMTTFLMSVSCIIMANVPEYKQIGISAAILVTICRAIQGMSSIGEIIGAVLYLTELTKPPIQYPVVAFMTIASVIGTTAALGMASFVTSFGLNWRIAFWIGAIIALIGAVARNTLRETPEFANARTRLLQKYQKANIDKEELKNDEVFNQKVAKKTTIYYFIMQCAWPICFYFTYITCGGILKNSFGYSAAQVIHQNFIVSIFHLIGLICVSYLSYKIYPLKIIKVKLFFLTVFIVLSPYFLNKSTDPFYVLIVQVCLVLFSFDLVPALPIFFKKFPVFKRFTYNSMIYAISRACMYLVTSFGMIYLTKYFGSYGLLVIMIPILIGCVLGLNYFQKLEP